MKLLIEEIRKLQQKHRPVHEKLLISDENCLQTNRNIVTLTKLKYFMSYIINLYCYQGGVVSMEEEIEGKYFLERFLPDIYKLLIKR